MKKLIWTVVAVLTVVALYVVFYQPDMLVEGSVVKLQPTASIKPITLTTPVKETPVTSPIHTTPTVVQPPVTAPVSSNTDPTPTEGTNPGNVLVDGFANYCYQMPDGSWTTVIFQGTPGANMYPYAGDLDPTTNAPATATGSEAWCAANAPNVLQPTTN